MRIRKSAFLKCAMVAVIAPSPSVFAAPAGGYLGLKVGYSQNNHSCAQTALECDRSGSGYGIVTGYDFNRRVGVELALTDVSDSSAVYPEIQLDGEISLIDISAKYSRVLWRDTKVFGKLGAAYWQGEVKGWGVKVDSSGFSPTFGVGISRAFAERWSARLEYQYFDKVGDSEIGHTQPSFLSLGVTWHFSSRPVEVPYPHSFLPPTPEPEPLWVADASTQSVPAETALNSEAALNSETALDSESIQTDAENTVQNVKPLESEGDFAAESPIAVAKVDNVPPGENPSAEEKPSDGPIVIDDHNDAPLFSSGSSLLKINYPLEKIAVELLRNPHRFVHIVVHTDERGSRAENLRLSKARAEKLADYLKWQGVNPDRISVEGKGQGHPLVKQTTEVGRARNRRAEFFISDTRPGR